MNFGLVLRAFVLSAMADIFDTWALVKIFLNLKKRFLLALKIAKFVRNDE